MKIENNDQCISQENELQLLRWASNQGTKKKRSVPTDGTLLGLLPRENSKETRYSWTSHNGHAYLRIQEFQFDIRTATWHPVKGKCYTVRIQELEKVYGILKKAIELVAAHALADLDDPFSFGDAKTDLIKEYEQMDLK